MRSNENIYLYVSIGKKIHEKRRNRSKLHSNILDFESWFIYQHQITILKIEFPKLNSGSSIFAVYKI